jgi:cell wall-associated NlpC family hydrolase
VRAFLTRLALVAALAVLVGPLPRAEAQTIDEKRAEAQRIASQLEAQGNRVSELAEEFNEARLRSDELEGKAAAAEAEVARLDREADRTRRFLRDQAVEAYIRGHVPAIADDTDLDPSRMQAYVDTIMGRRRDALDAMRQARLALSEEQQELATARREARAALAEMDASRRQAEAATAAQRTTLNRVQGELASLVDAETRRRAEVDARRAQEAAAVRAAARDDDAPRAASPSPAPRTGSPGTTAKPRVTEPKEPDGPPPGPPASGASAAVAKAKEQIGKPYEYGADGPDSFDCSGLTQYAWKAGGKSLPHSSKAQYSGTTRVPTDSLLPGDLLFYGSPIHHVGIYVGNGQMVEASQTGTPVRYASIWRRDLVGAGRVY